MRFSLFYLLNSQKFVHLQCVFHSIRFKVNKKDWLSGIDSLFFVPIPLLVFLNPYKINIQST